MAWRPGTTERPTGRRPVPPGTAPTIWDVHLTGLSPANARGDIYLLWDNNNAQGDWSLAAGDVQTGQDLETACLVSLLLDKLATLGLVELMRRRPTGAAGRPIRPCWTMPFTRSRTSGNSRTRQENPRCSDSRNATPPTRAAMAGDPDGVAKLVLVNAGWLGSGSSTLPRDRDRRLKAGRIEETPRFLFGWAWSGLAEPVLARIFKDAAGAPASNARWRG